MVSGLSGGVAANSLITGATDEHASVLFEVMFRKNNDLRGNNRIEGQMWVPRVNSQKKCWFKLPRQHGRVGQPCHKWV